jgi:nucleoside-diphosphate-sugar epimerase
MRVLVIGGSGFIGPHVVQALENGGHEVTVFHRGTAKSQVASHKSSVASHKSSVLGDRRHLADYAGQLRALKPDVVVDVILSSGRQARELVDVFRGVASRVVALSSGDVYRACGILHRFEEGPLQRVPLTESSALRTKSQTYPAAQIKALQDVFGWFDDEYDKIPVEREILGARDLPGTVLRLPMVYGPGDFAHRFHPIVKRIVDKRPAILFEEKFAAWRPPRGYVENVAAAIALAATSDLATGRIYNIAEPDSPTELEWAKQIARMMAWTGEFVVLPADRMPAHLKVPANFDQHWVYDTSRVREELGFREPIAREEAVRRTIEWERANPPTSFNPHPIDYDAEDKVVGTGPIAT